MAILEDYLEPDGAFGKNNLRILAVNCFAIKAM